MKIRPYEKRMLNMAMLTLLDDFFRSAGRITAFDILFNDAER